jgi:hypothetical protein
MRVTTPLFLKNFIPQNGAWLHPSQKVYPTVSPSTSAALVGDLEDVSLSPENPMGAI